jgi:hypothetical protein
MIEMNLHMIRVSQTHWDAVTGIHTSIRKYATYEPLKTHTEA